MSKSVEELVKFAQMVQAAPRAYGERHMLQLCSAVLSLSDRLKSSSPEERAPQRYDVFTNNYQEDCEVTDNKRGRWVKWDDVKHLFGEIGK